MTHKNILDALARGNETRRKKQKLIEDEYYLHPKLCLNCSKPIEYIKRIKFKFCGHSCAAQYNNLGRKHFHKNKIKCLICEKVIPNRNRKYCSMECAKKDAINKTLIKLKNGTLSDPMARVTFRKISPNICAICGNTEWNGKPIPLVVDHIDGIHTHNLPSNLRMICPNCDRQLPTFGYKNLGNGRTRRRRKIKS
jgi:hypothetical protein